MEKKKKLLNRHICYVHAQEGPSTGILARRNKAVYILKKNGVFYCIHKHMLILIAIVKLLFCSSRKKIY
jgi:hypothetical protein